MRKTTEEWKAIHKAELSVLCQFLTQPMTKQQIEDELTIINLSQKLRRWTKEGILKNTKQGQAYVYTLANYEQPIDLVKPSNSRIYLLMDVVRPAKRESRQRNYVSGSTLSGVF